MKPAALVVCVGAFAAFSIGVKRELLHRDATTSALSKVSIGKPMPDFTVVDRNGGGKVRLSTVVAANKVVLVNFWGSWCAPCRIEMPEFEEMYKSHAKDGFAIVSIDENEPVADLDKYLAKKLITFPVLLDSVHLADNLGVQAYPTSILIGRDGKVAQVIQGVQSYLPSVITVMLKDTSVKKP